MTLLYSTSTFPSHETSNGRLIKPSNVIELRGAFRLLQAVHGGVTHTPLAPKKTRANRKKKKNTSRRGPVLKMTAQFCLASIWKHSFKQWLGLVLVYYPRNPLWNVSWIITCKECLLVRFSTNAREFYLYSFRWTWSFLFGLNKAVP